MAEDLIDLLSVNGFCNVDADVVKRVTDSNFADSDDVTEALQNTPFNQPNCTQLLLQGVSICWQINANNENGDDLWNSLRERELCTSSLLVFLKCCMDECLAKESTCESMSRGMAALQFYLSFAALPASHAYRIFNSFLYSKTVDCAKSCVSRLAILLGRPGMSKGKGKQKKSNVPVEESHLGDTPEELTENIERYVEVLWQFLNKVSMKNTVACLGATVHLLANQIMLLDGHNSPKLSNVQTIQQIRELNLLSEKAFACLFLCTSTLQDTSSRLVLRGLMPRLLLLNVDCVAVGQAPSAPVIAMKDVCVNFIVKLMQREDIHPSVLLLLKTMCTKVPDKIEFRTKVANTITDLLYGCTLAIYSSFLEFFSQLADSKSQEHRGFAADVAPLLFEGLAEDSSLETQDSIAKMVAKVLLTRAMDKFPTVRQRALTHMATLIHEANGRMRQVLMQTTIQQDTNGDTSNSGDPPIDMSWIIRSRSRDSKVNVRKAAIQLAHALGDDSVACISAGCSDSALSVRKTSADLLSNLVLTLADSDELRSAWLKAVLPMVIDRESSAQDTAINCVQQVVFNNIAPTDKQHIAWKILAAVERQTALQRYMQRAVRKLIDNKSLTQTMVALVEAQNKDEARAPASWMLLAELSSGLKLSARGTRVAWHLLDSEDRVMSYMARILANAVDRMNEEEANELLTDMKHKVESFSLSPDVVPAVVYATTRLIKRVAPNKHTATADCQNWCKQMCGVSEKHLANIVFNEECGHVTQRLMCAHLATVGEVVQYVTKLCTSKLFVILEALVASQHLQVQFSAMQRTGQWHTLSRPQSALSQQQRPLSTTHASQQTNASAHQTMSTTLIPVTTAIRSNAVTTLGKMCLQDENSANKCVAALVRELAVNKDAIIRNNIMVVLSDLCIRYTSLVDRHVATISRCLKDPSTLVRHQTLSLVTVLLKEDFLKCKGILLYRFVSSLLDGDPAIREFTEFCLVNVLLARHEKLFSLHLLECLFYFNGVTHPSWEALNGTPILTDDTHLFSLRGVNKRDSRMQLYTFMLRHFSDFDKLNVAAKLSNDILGGIVDELITFNNDSEELLSDALLLLSSKSMKMKALSSKQNTIDEDLQDNAPETQIAKNLLAQMISKAIKENVIPCAVALKHFLESRRSPAERLLLIYLRELMKEHKNEIMEVLASDKRTANEIEYELQRLNIEERKEKESNTCRTLTRNEPSPTDEPTNPTENDAIAPQVQIAPSRNVEREKSVTPLRPTQNELANPGNRESSSGNGNDKNGVDEPAPGEIEGEIVDRLIAVKRKSCDAFVSPNPKLKQIREEQPVDDEDGDELGEMSGFVRSTAQIAGRAISTPVHASKFNELTFAGDVSAINFESPKRIPLRNNSSKRNNKN